KQPAREQERPGQQDLRPVVDDHEVEPKLLAAEKAGDRQHHEREGGPGDDVADRLYQDDAPPLDLRRFAIGGAQRKEDQEDGVEDDRGAEGTPERRLAAREK